MAEGSYDAGHGGSTGGSGGNRVGGAWKGTMKPDHELTQVRLPAGLVRRFDAWLDSQFPGAKRPSKDPYVARVFEDGLARFEEAFPPVQSLDEKLAGLDKKAG